MKSTTYSRVRLAALLTAALSLLVLAVMAVIVGVELVQYLNNTESAWTAPWVNTINRGPVQ